MNVDQMGDVEALVPEFMAALGAAGGGEPAEPDMMKREAPDPSPARLALVKRMAKSIAADKVHWERDFKRMRANAALARRGASQEWADGKLYIANITQRVLNTKVAALYAKNPTLKVTRRHTMDFKLWDGSAATLQAAAMDPGGAGAPLIMDVTQGTQRRKMMDGLAKTLQIVGQYEVNRQKPPFKTMMKGMVKRATVAGVGYVKLSYQRSMEPTPEVVTRTSELEARIANIERLKADAHDKDGDGAGPDDADTEALRLALAELEAAPRVVTSQGLRFDYPEPDAIIPHRMMTELAGFGGADYVTEQFLWSPETIQELFGVDIDGGMATAYHPTEDRTMEGSAAGEADDDCRLCVWCSYNRKDGLVYWLVDGYKDFLSEPAPPPILLERFYPWFPLAFNMAFTTKEPMPPSDVELIQNMQEEYNRSRQALRDHRIANRPKYAYAAGAIDDEDITRLTTADAHEAIPVKGLAPGQKIEDLLQSVKHAGVDPGLYEVNGVFEDIQRTIGVQEADMGGTSGATATETSIAENARATGMSSNIDDMDMLLSELMQEAGRVLLMEMDDEAAVRIAGPGAIWPSLAPEDVMDILFMDVEAGSSGRPNKQAETQAFERLAPILMQVPGVKPEWMIRQAITRMDDKLDPTDAILDGIPAIMAMSRMAPGAGPPGGPANPQAEVQGGANGGTAGNAPDMQGGAGAGNAPMPPGAVMQPPAMPAPGSGARSMVNAAG